MPLRLVTVEGSRHTPDSVTDQLFAELVTEVNTFALGDLVALNPAGGHLLADRTSRPAIGMVYAPSGSDFWLVTQPGKVVPWAAHGLGARGTLRWLDVVGGTVATIPTAADTIYLQAAYRVWDANSVIVFPATYVEVG